MTYSDIHQRPQLYARIGGALYLVIIAVGLFGEMFVRSRLVVASDPAATAANIRSMESLWRFHIAAELLLLICAVVLLLIFFELLKPVSSDLAWLAVLFNLVSISLEAAYVLHLLGAVFPLGNASYLRAFSPDQLYAMTYLSLKSHSSGFAVSLVFFGCFCLVVGYLIFKSTYLPKAIGILMQVAGLCYLTNSFALILAPPVANRLFPAILFPAFVGEMSVCLWLLLKGVNLQKWTERATARD